MRIYDIIQDKKLGKELTKEQIEYWINSMMNGEVADYQTSALLMAICINGLSEQESIFLTQVMARSGEMLDLSKYGDNTADKHSSGGVGDSTTFVVLPIVVACGMVGAKMSGRGLGHTGGTLDKLESIPGLNVNIGTEAFYKQVDDIGIIVAGQSKQICPADKKLYALRDVTATIDNVGLIASSIMSKKLASGSKNITLDVKCGRGAFMKDFDHAKQLANLMVKIGKANDRNICAVITNMNYPLSNYIGNSLEVYGAIEVLQGKSKGNLYNVSIELATQLLTLHNVENAREKAIEAINTGKAFEVFKNMIKAQGGDLKYLDNPTLLLNSKYTCELKSKEDGYISDINALDIASVVCDLGGGRKKVEDKIDYYVGVKLHVNVGDFIHKDDVIATIYYDNTKDKELFDLIDKSIILSDKKPEKIQLILDIIK